MGRGYSLPMSFESNMPKIDVYGRPQCPWCDRVKILLEANGYPFTYRDITDTATYDEFMGRTLMARTVPQVLVGNTLIGGFEATLEAIKDGRFQQIAGGS